MPYGDADIKRLVGVTMKSVVNEGDEQTAATEKATRLLVAIALVGCARPPLPSVTPPMSDSDVITVCVTDRYRRPWCWTGDVREWRPRVVVTTTAGDSP